MLARDLVPQSFCEGKTGTGANSYTYTIGKAAGSPDIEIPDESTHIVISDVVGYMHASGVYQSVRITDGTKTVILVEEIISTAAQSYQARSLAWHSVVGSRWDADTQITVTIEKGGGANADGHLSVAGYSF